MCQIESTSYDARLFANIILSQQAIKRLSCNWRRRWRISIGHNWQWNVFLWAEPFRICVIGHRQLFGGAVFKWRQGSRAGRVGAGFIAPNYIVNPSKFRVLPTFMPPRPPTEFNSTSRSDDEARRPKSDNLSLHNSPDRDTRRIFVAN